MFDTFLDYFGESLYGYAMSLLAPIVCTALMFLISFLYAVASFPFTDSFSIGGLNWALGSLLLVGGGLYLTAMYSFLVLMPMYIILRSVLYPRLVNVYLLAVIGLSTGFILNGSFKSLEPWYGLGVGVLFSYGAQRHIKSIAKASSKD